MGTPDFAVGTLKELIDNQYDVVAVVTQPDKPKGRSKELVFSPVKEEAVKNNIQVLQPERARDEAFVEELRTYNADVIVVVAFGQLLPASIINMPRYGCINVHASLLPKYRGAAPIQWAVIDGEEETGVTTMYMAEGLDTGDVIDTAVIKLDEKEMIAHTIDVFYSNENIDEIIVCIREEEEYFFEHEILDKYDFRDIKIAYGGKERQDSIYNGLKKLDSNSDIVLIHDGARPFVSHAIINETIQVAKNKKAAVVGVPVRDTIKVVENGVVKSTPSRQTLWSAQTPQTFDKDLLIRAYENSYSKNFYGTDDSMLVEFLGQEVTMVLGSYENIKITNPEDINVAEQILNLRKKSKMGKRMKKIG